MGLLTKLESEAWISAEDLQPGRRLLPVPKADSRQGGGAGGGGGAAPWADWDQAPGQKCKDALDKSREQSFKNTIIRDLGFLSYVKI